MGFAIFVANPFFMASSTATISVTVTPAAAAAPAVTETATPAVTIPVADTAAINTPAAAAIQTNFTMTVTDGKSVVIDQLDSNGKVVDSHTYQIS